MRISSHHILHENRVSLPLYKNHPVFHDVVGYSQKVSDDHIAFRTVNQPPLGTTALISLRNITALL